MSRKSKNGFYCLMLVVVVLSLASIACDNDDSSWIAEVQDVADSVGEYDGTFGDALGIGDKLEDVTGNVFD